MAKGGYMGGIFGSSPVSPLQKHMSKVYSCASELIPLFNAVINEDWDEVAKRQQLISSLEQEADVLKKALRLNLPKGLFMPVSRQDLLEVLLMQDRIANQAKDIAGTIIGRHMVLPEVIHEDYIRFVTRCVAACKQARKAINELDELVETGFSGQEIQIVTDMITKLDNIESDTDNLQSAIRTKIFEIENKLPPVEVMFLYKIIEGTGEVADRSQGVGSRLQLMLAR
ncbi:Phosphate transport regulator (distant homolog of PhoU) [hydrothermal vent metagenome]|uniref:Phosphate transport regulator (Distant homolog of PhoU) n=1 Tax=hydrothermal vent metagenome TaxID=652676 RepID=A0A3B0WXE0_9ZZZZ